MELNELFGHTNMRLLSPANTHSLKYYEEESGTLSWREELSRL